MTDRIAERRGQPAMEAAEDGPRRPPPQSFEEFRRTEKQRILEALEEHNWNRVRAAKALGMARRTFYRRLKQYDILE